MRFIFNAKHRGGLCSYTVKLMYVLDVWVKCSWNNQPALTYSHVQNGSRVINGRSIKRQAENVDEQFEIFRINKNIQNVVHVEPVEFVYHPLCWEREMYGEKRHALEPASSTEVITTNYYFIPRCTVQFNSLRNWLNFIPIDKYSTAEFFFQSRIL
jgi:hypothetical protein